MNCTRYSLEQIRADRKIQADLVNKIVRIFSGEHKSYWRRNGYGYTPNVVLAGLFEFEEAWRRLDCFGEDKKIEIEVVRAHRG